MVGPPAVGKHTIGSELADLTGAALIDNHLVNDPIFRAYGADGRTPLPDWVWELVERVREATMTAVTDARPEVSHIFTNYLSSEPEDEQFVQMLRDTAAGRGAQFVPVWLTCPEDELVRRVALPGRAERHKLRDADALRTILRTQGVLPAPPDALVLDTSAIPSPEAAQRIVDHTHAALSMD
nr:AAA family ATPase [Phytoactinopolyspora alkaliphila]